MSQRLKPFVLSLSKHEGFKSLLMEFSVHPSTSSGRTENPCYNQHILLIDNINSYLNGSEAPAWEFRGRSSSFAGSGSWSFRDGIPKPELGNERKTCWPKICRWN
jgi:hypothetical protein